MLIGAVALIALLECEIVIGEVVEETDLPTLGGAGVAKRGDTDHLDVVGRMKDVQEEFFFSKKFESWVRVRLERETFLEQQRFSFQSRATPLYTTHFRHMIL